MQPRNRDNIHKPCPAERYIQSVISIKITSVSHDQGFYITSRIRRENAADSMADSVRESGSRSDEYVLMTDPQDRTFDISGENMVNDNTEGSGGFIVTVSLKEEDVPENVKELKADQEASIEVSLTEEESEATEQSDETQDVQYTEEESQDDQNIYDYQTYDNNDYTDDDNGYDNNDEYNYSENYYQDDDETGGDDEYNTDGYYEETYE